MADEELLERLRAIARDSGISLGEVIRQGLELRAAVQGRVPSFLGAVATGEPGSDAAERHEEILYGWRS